MDHHTVPRFYLKGFRDPTVPGAQGPRVWQADLRDRRVELRSPKSMAKAANYYAIVRDGGEPDHTVEREFLQRIETAAAPVLAQLVAGGFQLTQQQRAYLATFMASLRSRVPAWRNAVEEKVGEVAEAVIRVAAQSQERFERVLRRRSPRARCLSSAEIENLRQAVLTPGNFAYRGAPEASLRPMLRLTATLERLLFKMAWTFVTPPRGRTFITGDNPVHWHDPTAAPPFDAGLMSRNAILSFPMTPQVCLMGAWRDHLPISHPGTEDVVENLNKRVVRIAERYVFTASKAEAEAALRLREALQAEGVTVGPQSFNLIIITEE